MVSRKGFLKFSARFWGFILIVAGIVTASILVYEYGPSRLLYFDNSWDEFTPYAVPHENASQYNVILDQHSHTLIEGGVLTVRQNVEWHIAKGFNTVIITDHDSVANKAEIDSLKAEYLAQGVVIIQGMEWTTRRLHMNFIGISKWDLPINYFNPTDQEIQDAIDEVHNQNGLVTVNHIPWTERSYSTDQPTRDELRAWGIDYIEIVNSWEWDNDSNNYCDAYGIGKITGTDMHSPGKVFGWTLLNVTTFSEESIMTALGNKETEIVYNASGFPDRGEYPDNPWYDLVRPLRELGGLFRDLWTGDGLDWVGSLTYLGYVLVIFAILEAVRYGKPKLKEKLNKRKNAPIKDK
jgi:predicted metal-dependent phosphoesterase TrpH